MAEPLWTLDDLTAAVGGATEGAPVTGLAGISIDTRTIGPGELFVALRDQRDGHDFVEAAFTKGAAAALVESGYVRKAGDGLLLRVADPLAALAALGRAARARLAPDARVIAVTGSAGKTTTKEMLRACCARLGPTHASEKSYNNHWGVPLTLARMPAATRYAILEIGMNHAGEITPLSRMARPHVAIVTTVLAAHLGNFASEEEIAAAKAEIFEGLSRDWAAPGIAVLGSANRHYPILRAAAVAAGARIVTFGPGTEDDARLVACAGADADPLAAQSLVVELTGMGRLAIDLGMAGIHNAENALAALLAIREADGDVAEAARALGHLSAPDGRGARSVLAVAGGHFVLIDESYNANPGSMQAALRAAAEVERSGSGRLIAVLGEMLELGTDAARLHLGLIDAIEAAGVDLVFAAGANMRHLYEALPDRRRGAWTETAADLREPVLATVRAGDVVMVKGSNGSRTWLLVEALKAESAKAPA